MRKILLLVFFFLVSTTLFAKKLEISFWHSLGFHVKELIDGMAEEYNENHPDVKVNPVFQGLFEDLQVKMLAAAVTKQLPDVAQVQFEYLEPYIANGLVEPLNSIIPVEEKEDIVEIMWDLVSRNGSIYGIPFCVSTQVFFYNEDAFKRAGLEPNKPPSTWDEVIKIGKKLTRDTDGDGEIDTYAMMFWTEGLYGLAPFLWANDGEFFSNDGKRILLTSKEMQKTITMLWDLVFKYRIMPQKWTDWEGGQAFLTGKLAMGPFTSAAIYYGEQNLPWKLRITPMPSVNGKRYTVLGGSALMNFSRNKKKWKAVNDFMFWLVNKENTIKVHEKVGYIPVRNSAINSLELKAFHKENPNYKVPIDGLSYARPLPNHVEYLKINEKLRGMLERIFLNGANPILELEKTEREINEMLK